MTDLELSSAVRHGRRQGFAQAAAAAFWGMLGAAFVTGFVDSSEAAAVVMATGALVGLGVAYIRAMPRG